MGCERTHKEKSVPGKGITVNEGDHKGRVVTFTV